MRYYYIYQIVHIETGKFYVGMRTSKVTPELDTRYWGSGTWIKRAIRQHGRDAFRKDILVSGIRDSDELARIETLIVTQELVDYEGSYNLTVGGVGGKRDISPEAYKRAGDTKRGQKRSEETKERMRLAQTGKTHSEESKKLIGSISAQRTLSASHKEALMKSRAGKGHTQESIDKMIAAKTGSRHTQETKDKISATKKRNAERKRNAGN